MCTVYQSVLKVTMAFLLVLHTMVSFSVWNTYSHVGMLVNTAFSVSTITWKISLYSFYVFRGNLLERMFHSINKAELLANYTPNALFLVKYSFVHLALSLLETVMVTLSYVHNPLRNKFLVFEIPYLIIRSGSDFFFSSFFIITTTLCAEFMTFINAQLKEISTDDSVQLEKYIKVLQHQYKQIYELVDYIQQAFSVLITLYQMYLAFILCFISYNVLTATEYSFSFFDDLVNIILHLYRLFAMCAAADQITEEVSLP